MRLRAGLHGDDAGVARSPRRGWLVVLLASCIAPAWAQPPGPSIPEGDSSGTPAQATASQPESQAPAPPPADGTRQQDPDDAQLPLYLQDSRFAADHAAYDPWERYNRSIYRFNKGVDTALGKPLAAAYERDVPEPVRDGVSHFFANLRQPVSAANLLLQGHPDAACKSLGRFAINTTIGIGGLFDPATRMHIPPFDEDFGQTLGHWGWRRSRYFLLPFLGPGTLRDRIGSLADTPLGPIGYLQPAQWRVAVIGLEVVDTRAALLPLDELGNGIDDDYILVREAWTQRRMHQIDDQSPDAGQTP